MDSLVAMRDEDTRAGRFNRTDRRRTARSWLFGSAQQGDVSKSMLTFENCVSAIGKVVSLTLQERS